MRLFFPDCVAHALGDGNAENGTRALSSLAISALMLCKLSSENGDGLDLQARICEKTADRELVLKSSKAPEHFLHKLSNLNFGLWDFPLLYTMASDVTEQANPSNR